MSETIVENGKVVSLNYSLYDEKGGLFEHRDIPVSYLHGSGSELFPKIEETLAGHAVGDKVPVELTPEDGFGEYDPNLMFTDNLENVPPELREVGKEVEAHNEQGEVRLFYVTKIDDDTLTVDGNHPLAGQTVNFIVIITDIRDATAEEIESGQPQGPPGGGPIPLV